MQINERVARDYNDEKDATDTETQHRRYERKREREREGGVGMKRRDARSLAPPPPSLSFILVDGMRRNLSPSLYNV